MSKSPKMQNDVQVERVETGKLVPYARNARTHSDAQVQQIAGSIREFGFTNPVLIDDENGIIAGHGRVLAAQLLGLADVPCIRLSHLNETKRRAYVLADNRIALNSGWDDAMLAIELAELQIDGVDLGALGFDDGELDKLLSGPDVPTDITEDDAPDVQATAISKPGDLWLVGRHRLLCGDSTNAQDVSRLMVSDVADLCFTSPPYNLGKSVGLRNGARKGSNSAYNHFDDSGGWLDLMNSFLTIAIQSSKVACVNVQMLSGNKMDLLRLFSDYSHKTIDVAIWVKSNPQPAMAEGVMTSAFEFMWLLRDSDNPTRSIPNASFKRGTFSNVFEHPTASGHDASVHGAVFPVKLAAHYIENLCEDRASVFDPFLGSGTTMIAAEQLNRKCYGMEISPLYCDVIVRRWQEFTGLKATLDGDGRTFSEIEQDRL